MLIVHPYFSGEYGQITQWLTWANEIGGARKHTGLFLLGTDVTPEMHAEVAKLAAKVYGKVDSIQAWEQVPAPWPWNANMMWQRAARHVSENIGTPWMWCEADCIPLRPGWWDEWEAEWKKSTKPFFGCVVKEPHHLTGNAVYPAKMEDYSSQMLLCTNIPFDVVDAVKIVPQCQHTDLYFHVWFYGVPPQAKDCYSSAATHWATVKDLDIIPKQAVLCHRNKDGSLIDRLRERSKAPVVVRENVPPAPPPPPPPAPPHQQQPEPTPEPEWQKAPRPHGNVGILVRTWHQDAVWLPFSLASLVKYVSGFYKVLVVAPENDEPIIRPIVENYGFEYRSVPNDTVDGYLAQQITKLRADELMPDADFILHHDSDTLFKVPTTPGDFIVNRRAEILMKEYAKFGNEKMPWQKPTEVALGRPVKYEFMRRHPLVYPKFLYRDARRRLTELHVKPWDQWVGEQFGPQKGFSEFNYLGALAYTFHRPRFRWTNVDRDIVSPDRVKQFWSWGGLTPEAQNEINTILA